MQSLLKVGDIMSNPMTKAVKRPLKFFTFLLIIFIFLVLLFFVIIFSVTINDGNNTLDFDEDNEELEDYDLEYSSIGISENILRYEKYFKKYAKKFFIEDQVDVIMALAMQESGGRHLDVMQSSESIGLPPNSITDPARSIEIGVKYFAESFKKADGDVKLALQGYNFGIGFIDYAKENGGYSKEVSIAFSEKMAKRQGWTSYGDIDYVDHVMRYLDEENSIPVNSDGDWSYPLDNILVTSEYGYRIHPIYKTEKLHAGIDFDCSTGDNVRSVNKGEVVELKHGNTGYGNYITIQHGKNEFSRYAHLSSISVEMGDKVKTGALIGKCGSTGGSTGAHLHLEHLTALAYGGESSVNPRDILGLN